MNREIKFRAWDAAFKVMLDSSYGNWISFDGIAYEEASRKHNTPNIEIEQSRRMFLMQYTGLKDKHGKEIYEGDIVELTAQLPITRCKIEWKDCGFVLTGIIPWQNKRVEFSEDQLNKRWENNYIEVIGNIYENPDLLP